MNREELSNRLCEINSCLGILVNLDGYDKTAMYNLINREMIRIIDEINDNEDDDEE